MSRRKTAIVSPEVMEQVEKEGLQLVDRITGKWIDKKTGTVQYRVKWLGRPKSYDSWEPLSSFESTMDIIDEYEKKRDEIRKRKAEKAAAKFLSSKIPKKTKICPVEKTQQSASPKQVNKVKGQPKESPEWTQPGSSGHRMEPSPEMYNSIKQYFPIADLSFVETLRDLTPIFGETMKIHNYLHYFVTWPSLKSFYLMTPTVAEKVYPEAFNKFLQSEREKPSLVDYYGVNRALPPDPGEKKVNNDPIMDPAVDKNFLFKYNGGQCYLSPETFKKLRIPCVNQ